MTTPRQQRPRARVAVVSLHTSPLEPPGAGDSGGMNVEIRAVAERLSARGVSVDVFTRCSGPSEVEAIAPLARVIPVEAGPRRPVQKHALGGLVDEFAEAIHRSGTHAYDVVHAHYWLSGTAALAVARRWGTPLVASFHTLAEVKSRAAPDGDAPEPLGRLAGERAAVRGADLLVAPTATETKNLVELYDADAERIRVVAPGVDHARFFPRPRTEARRRLRLGDGPVVLFVGRLQPLKGPEVAVGAFARARRRTSELASARLLIVGGPSGASGDATVRGLRRLVADEGIAEAVRFLGPRPHGELPWIYSAADVLVMPSRSESFGLAALEAQATGLPVIGSDVGGLRHAVRDGVSGVLVTPDRPSELASVLRAVVRDAALADRLAAGARANAARFTWERTADALLDVYGELVPELAPAAAS